MVRALTRTAPVFRCNSLAFLSTASRKEFRTQRRVASVVLPLNRSSRAPMFGSNLNLRGEDVDEREDRTDEENGSHREKRCPGACTKSELNISVDADAGEGDQARCLGFERLRREIWVRCASRASSTHQPGRRGIGGLLRPVLYRRRLSGQGVTEGEPGQSAARHHRRFFTTVTRTARTARAPGERRGKA